jgi:hypothetical protein
MTSQIDSSSINRSAGETTGLGAIVGSGYSGKRDDQDDAVAEFARRLADLFPHDVEIRFNSNSMGGGAWLVDGERDAQVGLGAKLVAPYEHRRQREMSRHHDDVEEPTRPKYLDPGELNLKFTVKLTHPAVDERSCNRDGSRDRSPYASKSYHCLERAWAMFQHLLNPSRVNPPVDQDEWDATAVREEIKQ